MTLPKAVSLCALACVLLAGTGCSKADFIPHEYHAGDKVLVDIGYTHSTNERILVEGVVAATSGSTVKVEFAINSLTGWYDRSYLGELK